MRIYPQIYSQRDLHWAGQQLGTASGATIGQYGCILACHAMKAGYYGHVIAPDALNDIYINKNIYVGGDLLPDSGVSTVFTDITLLEVHDYTSIPADLTLLKTLAADQNKTVTIEIDFDHIPNDGIQTHFVELHDFDGTTLTIYDPWYGSNDTFTLHYGSNFAQTIQKIAVYAGTPTKPPVAVDPDIFERLVANSTAYDTVCDELGLPHNSGKDSVVAILAKLKADGASKQLTIDNLNKQIPVFEGEVSTLNNRVTDLQQKLESALTQVDQLSNFKKLYEQVEIDLGIARKNLADLQATYNRTIAQKNNATATAANGTLVSQLVKNLLHLK